MSQTLTKPILLDETGQNIKQALNNINDTESQDWLLSYEDIHSELDDNMKSIAESLSSINKIIGYNSFPVPNWSDGTDEEITQALKWHYNGYIDLHDYWSVGDERVIKMPVLDQLDNLQGEIDVVFVLTDFGGKELTTSINNRTECAFQVDIKTGYFIHQFNTTDTNSGGWNMSEIRQFCNTNFRNAVPDTIVGIFKEFKNKSGLGSGIDSLTDTNDYFALRSVSEFVGDKYDGTYTSTNEGVQLNYYKTDINRYKYRYIVDWNTRTVTTDTELNTQFLGTRSAILKLNGTSNTTKFNTLRFYTGVSDVLVPVDATYMSEIYPFGVI